jgi:hypothetical protein
MTGTGGSFPISFSFYPNFRINTNPHICDSFVTSLVWMGEFQLVHLPSSNWERNGGGGWGFKESTYYKLEGRLEIYIIGGSTDYSQ